MTLPPRKLPCGGCGRSSPTRALRVGDCPWCQLYRYWPDAAVLQALGVSPPPHPVAAAPAPAAGGPGTELRELLKELGVTDKPNCGCNKAAADMDALGVAGVRADPERFAAFMRANAARLGWIEYAKVAARAVARGLVLNPLDPYRGLVEEACRRAEAKA